MKYDQNRWFSLRFAVHHLWFLRKKYGDIVVASNKYKKEREAWTVAVALLGITKISGELWWIQIPTEDPPDILAMTVTPNEKEGWNYINFRKVEVMEITMHSKGNVVDEILNKIKDKFYEKETGLVVYLRQDTNLKDMCINKLSVRLKKRVKNIADIWIIGNTSPNTNDFIVFSIFPTVQVIRYNVNEEIRKIPLGDTIEMSRAKGTEMMLIKSTLPVEFNPKVR